MLRHAAAVGALALLTATAGSACDGATSAEERLAAAQEATLAETARAALTVANDSSGESTEVENVLSVEGEVDFPAGRAALETERPEAERREAERRETDQRGLTVVDGDVAYQQGGVVDRSSDGSERMWIRHEDPRGVFPRMLGPSVNATGSPDPARLLAALDDVRGGVERLGDDEVRDVAVEGFAFRARADALARDADLPPASADAEIGVEVWLDADDRVRRLTATLDLADFVPPDAADADRVPAGTDEGVARVVLELFDFGADVTIDVPDPDEVRVLEADGD